MFFLLVMFDLPSRYLLLTDPDRFCTQIGAKLAIDTDSRIYEGLCMGKETTGLRKLRGSPRPWLRRYGIRAKVNSIGSVLHMVSVWTWDNPFAPDLMV